jgi:mRNA interferase MazF
MSRFPSRRSGSSAAQPANGNRSRFIDEAVKHFVRGRMAKATRITLPRRGEAYLVTFDPTVAAEIRKTRPCACDPERSQESLEPITIVAAITSRFEERLYPTEVFVGAPEGGLAEDSVVLLNQIPSVDKGGLCVGWAR